MASAPGLRNCSNSYLSCRASATAAHKTQRKI